jgi:hypothetical protein
VGWWAAVVRRNNHSAHGVLVDAEQLTLDLADAEHILVTYDKRLAAVALDAGPTVAAPA